MNQHTDLVPGLPACLSERGEPWACGSHSTYNNHGCRGDACRAANVDFNRSQRERRHQRMLAGELTPVHGKESTYFNYMCRCEACRLEHNSREVQRRNKRVGNKVKEVPVALSSVPDDVEVYIEAMAGMEASVTIAD